MPPKPWIIILDLRENNDAVYVVMDTDTEELARFERKEDCHAFMVDHPCANFPCYFFNVDTQEVDQYD